MFRCVLCKGEMKYNKSFEEWYCVRCGKTDDESKGEIWEAFKDTRINVKR